MFSSRQYRKGKRSSEVSVEVEGDDEAALKRAATRWAVSQIGSTRVGLGKVTEAGRKLNSGGEFFDGDTGEQFRGTYPGADIECLPFRVRTAVVKEVRIRKEIIDGTIEAGNVCA